MKSPKYLLCLSCLLLLPTATLFAESFGGSAGTAYTLPKGRFEMGLFQPLRYGQTDRLEWSIHPLWSLVLPNGSLKRSWQGFLRFSLPDTWEGATRHTVAYPTPLLRLLTRKGIGGIISPEFSIPHMVLYRGEILISHPMKHDILLTAKLGGSLAWVSKKLDPRTSIDLPIVFPRLGVFHNHYGVNTGVDMLKKVGQPLSILMDMDVFFLPGAKEDLAIEHKGMLVFTRKNIMNILVGYKLIYGEYPFGAQWHLLPVFDIQWSWGNKEL